jgi:putative chemoreceptor
MLYLGIIDVGAIVGNSLFAGYYAFTGALYCTHPTLMYITGSIEIGTNRLICVIPKQKPYRSELAKRIP